MNNIHPQSAKPSNQDLDLAYAETKALERGMQTALDAMAQQYEQALRTVEVRTEDLLSCIKGWEETVFSQLDSAKDLILGRVDEQWHRLKDYSRLVRKVYLGDQTNAKLDYFPLQEVRQMVQAMKTKLNSLQAISDSYHSHCLHVEATIRKISTISTGSGFVSQS